MDDRELALIAVFRLQEVAGRLGVLSRVATSCEVRNRLLQLSEELAEHVANMSKLAQSIPADERGKSDTHPARGS